jgi:hypothetical protein
MALRAKRSDGYVVDFEPKFITFDCYGTSTNFRMGAVTRELVADLVSTDRMDAFVDDFEAQRLDEVLGPWKPYPEVVKQSFRTTLEQWNLGVHRPAGAGLQAEVPGIPVPLRPARRARRHPPRVLEPALRPDVRPRPPGDEQGLREPGIRADQPVFWLPRDAGLSGLPPLLGL